jgi:RNA recognition motif-containing protein
VFVGNLAFETTSQEIEALFGPYGEVAGVSVPTDRMTGRPRGFAFVEFVRSEDAAEAIEKLNGHELGGRPLRVNEATERPGPGRGFGGPSAGRAFRPPPRPSRPKGSRRNVRARKRSIW